jgi:hypothetical protein
MNKFSKISLDEIQLLGHFISENRSNPSIVIDELGVISSDNGYGTKFLIPKSALFKLVWVYEKNNKIESVGLGGPSWELALSQIFSHYPKYSESYNRYDDEYDYVFYKNIDYDYAIKISSKSLLLDQGELRSDAKLGEIVIVLR